MSFYLATYQTKQRHSVDFFSTRCIAKKTHDLPAQKFKVRCAHASDDAYEGAMNASGLRTVRNQSRHLTLPPCSQCSSCRHVLLSWSLPTAWQELQRAVTFERLSVSVCRRQGRTSSRSWSHRVRNFFLTVTRTEQFQEFLSRLKFSYRMSFPVQGNCFLHSAPLKSKDLCYNLLHTEFTMITTVIVTTYLETNG
jgi:hypothetical protein